MGTVIATRSQMPARRSRAATARRGRRRFWIAASDPESAYMPPASRTITRR